jgi:hypothetical protein
MNPKEWIRLRAQRDVFRALAQPFAFQPRVGQDVLDQMSQPVGLAA